MFQAGDSVNRIGDKPVDGLVLKVTVDMGDDPGTVLEVGVGEQVRKVTAGACGSEPNADNDEEIWKQLAAEAALTAGRDGETMPVAEGADVTAGVN